jgi:aspartate carbamoyltransferase regulatory subunit
MTRLYTISDLSTRSRLQNILTMWFCTNKNCKKSGKIRIYLPIWKRKQAAVKCTNCGTRILQEEGNIVEAPNYAQKN